MKMKAVVLVREEIEFDIDVPEPEFEELEPRNPDRRINGEPYPSPKRMVNEEKVLKARGNAAKRAEKLAKDQFKGALGVQVEEVTEA